MNLGVHYKLTQLNVFRKSSDYKMPYYDLEIAFSKMYVDIEIMMA